MNFFGLEVTGDHARIVAAALTGVVATAGYAAGRWAEHRRRVHFRKEDLVTSSIIIEFYGIRSHEGGDTLHIVTQGSSATLDTFFRNPELVRNIQRAAAKHPGLLKLDKPVAHRMMMDEGKDTITGLDPKANMDFLNGRPTRDDATLMGYAAYGENHHDGQNLRDQVARVVLMVASPALVEKFASAAYAKSVGVAHAGYRPRCDRLHDFAKEWQRLQALPASERSAATDKIWQITVRTQL
jgi:hypothetical protein